MIKAGKIILIFTTFLIALPAITWSSTDAVKSDITEAETEGVMKVYGRLPLYFIENDGQIDKKVKYYERGSGHSTFFTSNGVYLSLIKKIKNETEENNIAEKPGDRPAESEDLKRELIELTFIDASKDTEVTAEGVQEGKINFFIGNDPEKWRSNISTYSIVKYKEVYKGIDIKFHGNNRQLEYDLIVSPGADPAKARLSYSGIKGLRVTEEGELEIELKEGKIIQKRPDIYQEIEGKRIVIEGNFILKADILKAKKNSFEYGFEVASYDKQYPLIIDPVLAYSTYLGGSSTDYGNGIAVDSSGSAYVTGRTISTDFPIVSAYQGSLSVFSDVFVTKLNAAGSALVYSTYLGGSSTDKGYGIAVDSSGSAYITGFTSSSDFPTASAYQGSIAGNPDVFVTKLSAAGSTLTYSTYLGGSASQAGYGIAVDSSGSAYVTGYTYSTDFPTVSAYQGSITGNMDVFVTKMNAAGSALAYSTYLGGSLLDFGYGIAVDSSGSAYVTGYSDSSDFPTASAYQGSKAGVSDAFVTKLNAAGSTLAYSTYLGGSNSEHGHGIAVDSSGSAYVTGFTSSSDFPTASAYQGSLAGGSDTFITKLNAAGSALTYSTYLGGSSNDLGHGIAVDSSGSAYITGETYSTNFPTVSAYQGGNAGGRDAFVTKLNTAGSAIAYSTYLGGISTEDYGMGIAVDNSGSAYVIGYTQSTDFPTVSAYQGSIAGSYDVFVTKISGDIADITEVIAGTGLTGGGASGAVTLNIDFAGTGTADTVARSDHDHDSSYVSISGDAMTGALTVAGVIESTIGGIKFPDSTIMTSANGVSGDFTAGGNIDAAGEYMIDSITVLKTETTNTYVGKNTGYSATGTGNVFLGYQAGYNETASNRLYIDNSSTSAPLIYGEFDNSLIEINGDLYVTGNTYVDSDENLKKDIKPIESSLKKILGIQGVSYKWKEARKRDSGISEKEHYGLIAQEVEKVMPEIVKKGENGLRKVAYMELIPVLIEAVKEQQKKDTEQSQIIKEQQNIISKLSGRLNELEREVKLKGSLASVTK